MDLVCIWACLVSLGGVGVVELRGGRGLIYRLAILCLSVVYWRLCASAAPQARIC